MTVVVAYASRHGATEKIAERIADVLKAAGLEVRFGGIGEVDVTDGEAFVIGSATYFGHWLKDAVEFVRSHRATFTDRPVWLFSSGPLGDKDTDDEGRDLREAAAPAELGELEEAVHPRDHRVFFGVLDPDQLRLRERAIRALPAGRQLLPEGDFRDWADIEAWARAIATELVPGPTRDG